MNDPKELLMDVVLFIEESLKDIEEDQPKVDEDYAAYVKRCMNEEKAELLLTILDKVVLSLEALGVKDD